MSWTRYLVHDFWTAREFNEIEERTKAHARALRRSGRRASRQREELETDVGFLALTLLSLVRSLVDKGVLSAEELRAHMRELDAADGVEDGRLDPDAARDSLGAPAPARPEPPAPKRRRRT